MGALASLIETYVFSLVRFSKSVVFYLRWYGSVLTL